MATISAKYLGDLRVECTHMQSGTKIITDAPVDNHGKGQAFSPTDLCATALGACAMTIIGLYAQNHGVDVTGAEMEITKSMSADPRRIGKVEVIFTMPDRPYSEKEKIVMERAAHTCPVHLSLHPDVEQVFTFNWRQ
ncbi:OsmC family protein [Desulfovibrio sp. PG-178-WT-4]|uniref:OsmC family protein n=1 Tax=Desulfovibrio porci TaxID=2605782 RepID=A0A6L5XHU4_9BACT|nr:OsmC family protein [Desulfovibrio porci]MDY3810758.1 OsmC family protein [Desulfovibrio porci]MSS26775.1 OsmC family protein [Desulfovibrio porci]